MSCVVAVVAHPDDDAYGIAGSVALHAKDPDFRFILVHATDGGAGDLREGFPATRQNLGQVRRLEDEAGWQALGRMPDRHEWLGYPDGELERLPFNDLVDAVSQVLVEEQPQVVFAFGPDGVFGHPDHITIGAATDAAFLRSAAEAGPASAAPAWRGPPISLRAVESSAGGARPVRVGSDEAVPHAGCA
jgi:LmbE family N-acetylglucosaminyl deacetylase